MLTAETFRTQVVSDEEISVCFLHDSCFSHQTLGEWEEEKIHVFVEHLIVLH